METTTDARHSDHFRPFWTGRTMRAFGVGLVLLAGLRWWWGGRMAARVQAQVEAARARGEPATAAAVKLADVPDGQNAWAVLTSAAAAAKPGVDSPRTSNLEYTTYPPYGPKWVQLAEGSEAVNGRVFALARRARGMPLARMREAFDPGPGWRATPSFGEPRHLAQLLADGAQLMEVRGESAEAVERIRDILHIARSARQDPELVSQVLAAGIDTLACEAAQIVAPGLKLGPGEERSGAARGGVRTLIAELLDDERDRAALAAAITTEHLGMSCMLGIEAGRRWVIRPLADRRIELTWALLRNAADAARRPTCPEATATLMESEPGPVYEDSPQFFPPAWRSVPVSVPRYSRWFWWTEEFGRWRIIERQFRALAERRVTAVLLAAQLYRADHGRWPERLDDLVPAYLAAVPRDPFRAGAPPLGYVILRRALPEGTDRPLVYFEPGAVDDQDPVRWREPMHGWSDGEINGSPARVPVRQYRDLARFRPADVKAREDGAVLVPQPGGGFSGIAPPPSAEGVDDDPDKAGRPRKGEEEKARP